MAAGSGRRLGLFRAFTLLGPTALLLGASPVAAVVFTTDGRQSVEDFAKAEKLDAAQLHRTYAASGLIQCGLAHGAGQLTLTDDVVTTAAHVFFDEKGQRRAKSCDFVVTQNGHEVAVPVNLESIVAGSTDPYAVAAVHDWAVARLAHPISDVVPYGLADTEKAEEPVEFVARGHIDWGQARRLSMERCHLHDQIEAGQEGTREFAFDCNTGDGASGGAVMVGDGPPRLGAVLVGWRSNKPFRAAPFSMTHYNFAVTVEGAFKKAVLAAANKFVVAK
jgi:hypothetical protein